MTKKMINYIRGTLAGLALLAFVGCAPQPLISQEQARKEYLEKSAQEYASLPTQRVQAVKGENLSTLLTRNAKEFPWSVQKDRYFHDNPNAVNDQINYDKFYIVRLGTNSIKQVKIRISK
jgi:hypothetical protein